MENSEIDEKLLKLIESASELCQRCTTLSVNGIHKLHKKCKAELAFLQKVNIYLFEVRLFLALPYNTSRFDIFPHKLYVLKMPVVLNDHSTPISFVRYLEQHE